MDNVGLGLDGSDDGGKGRVVESLVLEAEKNNMGLGGVGRHSDYRCSNTILRRRWRIQFE